MATHYVDSAAAGSNNGTTEADAWTSIASAVSVAAGDVVWVSHTHSETALVTVSFANGTLANPVVLLCVNFGTNALATGAVCQASVNLTLSGNIYSYGINWESGTATTHDLTMSMNGQSCKFENCTISWSDFCSFSGNSSRFEFVNVTCNTAIASSDSIVLTGRGGRWIFKSCSFEKQADDYIFVMGAEAGTVEVIDSDCSNHSALCSVAFQSGLATFRRCKVKSAFTATTGTWLANGGQVNVENCDDGTITVPALGINGSSSPFGTINTTLAVYRSSGATDGVQANAASWEMAASANCKEIYKPLESPALAFWIAADAGPSGATARGLFQTTRCAPLSTPAALTTDSVSTWTGAGVGTKQKTDVTIGDYTLTIFVASGVTLNNDDFWVEVSAPDQVGGPLSVRCFLAVPSTTVYVDPQIVIGGSGGGNEMVFEGSQVTLPASSGGTLFNIIGTS